MAVTSNQEEMVPDKVKPRSGLLFKLGARSFGASWKERYFMVKEDRTVVYFDRKGGKRLGEFLCRPGYTRVTALHNPAAHKLKKNAGTVSFMRSALKKKRYVIEVADAISGSAKKGQKIRSYYLYARNAPQFRDWVVSLVSACGGEAMQQLQPTDQNTTAAKLQERLDRGSVVGNEDYDAAEKNREAFANKIKNVALVDNDGRPILDGAKADPLAPSDSESEHSDVGVVGETKDEDDLDGVDLMFPVSCVTFEQYCKCDFLESHRVMLAANKNGGSYDIPDKVRDEIIKDIAATVNLDVDAYRAMCDEWMVRRQTAKGQRELEPLFDQYAMSFRMEAVAKANEERAKDPRIAEMLKPISTVTFQEYCKICVLIGALTHSQAEAWAEVAPRIKGQAAIDEISAGWNGRIVDQTIGGMYKVALLKSGVTKYAPLGDAAAMALSELGMPQGIPPDAQGKEKELFPFDRYCEAMGALVAASFAEQNPMVVLQEHFDLDSVAYTMVQTFWSLKLQGDVSKTDEYDEAVREATEKWVKKLGK